MVARPVTERLKLMSCPRCNCLTYATYQQRAIGTAARLQAKAKATGLEPMETLKLLRAIAQTEGLCFACASNNAVANILLNASYSPATKQLAAFFLHPSSPAMKPAN